jgi:Family of unknown function (DUF6069)
MSSIALSPSAPAASRRGSRGRFARVGLATVAAAVLANLLVYAAGSMVVGYDPGFVVLANASGTILFTVVPALGAVLLYAALRRFARRPARAFAIIAAGVLVVSLIPDVTYIPTVPGATAGQTAILVLMHAVAAGVIVGMLTTLARPQAR